MRRIPSRENNNQRKKRLSSIRESYIKKILAHSVCIFVFTVHANDECWNGWHTQQPSTFHSFSLWWKRCVLRDPIRNRYAFQTNLTTQDIDHIRINQAVAAAIVHNKQGQNSNLMCNSYLVWLRTQSRHTSYLKCALYCSHCMLLRFVFHRIRPCLFALMMIYSCRLRGIFLSFFSLGLSKQSSLLLGFVFWLILS